MSHVTNVILITSVDEQDFVSVLNTWIESHCGCRVCRLDSEDAGGTKHLEVEVFAGAFNHLNFSFEELRDEAVRLMPVLVESGGDASFTWITQDGEHKHWAANIW